MTDEELELKTTKFRSLLETPQTLKKVLGGIKGKARTKKPKKPKVDMSILDF